MPADANPRIALATTEEDIMKCFLVLKELRPHLERASFVERIRSQQAQGYQLAFVHDEAGACLAVAGFRIGENLAWGRFMYVDDLVTASTSRSHGHGSALVAWLEEYAREQGCQQLHLDSGTQRTDAHRFYLRERLVISAFHFQKPL